MSNLYFPLFVDLTDRQIVVVGAGRVAARRVCSLVEFAGRITVIAPAVRPELAQLEADGQIQIRRKRFERADLQGADLVLAATNEAAVNEEIYRICQERGILVNVCSEKEKCDFYFPGIARDGDVVVGVTAGGQDHGKVRRVTGKIREMLRECW